jgi:uncharacterized repeat protein (TIGR01451 family)
VKGVSHFLSLGLLTTAIMVACPRAGAQQFGLSVTASANSILVSNSLTYTINVTNIGGSLNDAVVTNVLPASAQFQSATYSQGTFLVNSNVVLFDLGTFLAGNVAQLTVTAIPTTVGFITNTATAASPAYITNTASASVVVQVTNVVIQADLGVTITGPGQVVITNDWMTYGVTVTNAGPNAAPSVMLTNTLPPGVISIFPTNQIGSSNLIYNLGTLISGGYTNLQFTVEPTNAGTLLFSASVGASGIMDTNTANNTASTNITVTNYLFGTLVAVTNSPQSINFQNALTGQSITLSNAGLSSVPAARVVVTGVTNQLFNAVGTNNGNPFVYYSAPLAAGQSVSLLLQYYPRGYFPFTNSQLSAFAVPLPDWTPPPATTGTNIISRIVELANGDMLIEWPSTVGQTYTVVYSTNVLFSNAMIAPPAILAPANRTQWIDYGPPTTVSAPTNASARFYRVFQNP